MFIMSLKCILVTRLMSVNNKRLHFWNIRKGAILIRALKIVKYWYAIVYSFI